MWSQQHDNRNLSLTDGSSRVLSRVPGDGAAMIGIPAWARIGAKVACIDAYWNGWTTGLPLTKDATYTIVDVVYTGGRYPDVCGYSLLLKETTNPSGGIGFGVERFRPLVSLESDLTAHFNALLHTPQKIEERA